MKDTAVVLVRWVADGQLIEKDVRVPLEISANELVISLNSAYDLGIDTQDYRQCYLRCERPIALLRGERSLRDFGVRNGTLIHGNE